jgi:hypothetical protein
VTTRDRPSCRNRTPAVRPLICGLCEPEFCPSCQSAATRRASDWLPRCASVSEWFNHFRIMVHSIGSLRLRGIVSQPTQLRIEAARTGKPLTCVMVEFGIKCTGTVIPGRSHGWRGRPTTREASSSSTMALAAPCQRSLRPGEADGSRAKDKWICSGRAAAG